MCCTIIFQGFGTGVAVSVRGPEPDIVAKVMVELRSRAPQPTTDRRSVVGRLRLLAGGQRAYTSTRRIACPAWDDVATVYPTDVRSIPLTSGPSMDRSVAHRPGPDDGRIILRHGPPGTGKTTAIRALAHAWAVIWLGQGSTSGKFSDQV